MPVLPPRMDANTSSNLLIPRTLPLENVKEWSQNVNFEIDALGLVTLLGADEVNLAVGTLQRRRYTEYLPLLAAFVISGNRFTAEQPGFILYNLSDGITSTELKGWFTRWLMSQKINNATTVFEWRASEKATPGVNLIAPTLSTMLVTPLLVCTILMGDWYGVGNSVAIIISIFTRLYLVTKLRQARDTQIQNCKKSPAQNPGTMSVAPEEKNGKDALENDALKVLCVIRSDGKMVTVKVPAEILGTFTKDCTLTSPHIYNWVRRAGWVALGAHMCILGMCTLFTQIYTVLLLVLSTWALSSNFGSDLQHEVEANAGGHDLPEKTVRIPFNKEWDVIKQDYPKEKKLDPKVAGSSTDCDRRQVAWARIQADEGFYGRMMDRWNLFPDRDNKPWWDEYAIAKAELHPYSSPIDQSAPTPSTPPRNSRPTVSQTDSSAHLLTVPRNQSGSDGRSLTPETSRSSSPSSSGLGDTSQAAPASPA